MSVDTEGSSPLAGRRPCRQRPLLASIGLIPARGETTSCPARSPGRCAAHPRSRGDDNPQFLTDALGVGSSPLAGRRPGAGRVHLRGGGLIPARGETTTHSS